MAPQQGLMADAVRKYPVVGHGKSPRKGRIKSACARLCVSLFYFSLISIVAFSFFYSALYFIKLAEEVGDEKSRIATTVEEKREYFRGCPVCDKGERGIPPLDRALSQKGAKIKLCTGSPSSPFISGTFTTQEMESRDGIEIGNRLAQLIIFEAEVRHLSAAESTELGQKRKRQKGSATGELLQTNLRFLSFLEDDESIKKTQWEGWGAAEPSDLYWKRQMKFKCLIWPGHDPYIQHAPPAYVVDAEIDHYYTFHIVFECKLPAYPSGSKRPTAGREARRYFVQRSPRFQVQLVAVGNDTDLRMQPILICRAEGEKDRIVMKKVNLPPPLPESEMRVTEKGLEKLPEIDKKILAAGAGENAEDSDGVEKEVEVGKEKGKEGGKEEKKARKRGGEAGVRGMDVAICLRPFHTRQLFSNKIAFSDERLLEWIDAHLLLGVDRIYFYDRYGMQKRGLLKMYVERGQVVYVPFPPWSEVFFRKGLYGGKARVPYLFPEIYDQVISYEHCMMQGRRNGDRWQFHIDSDEFLFYSPRRGAFLKPLLARLEANHSRTSGGEPLRVLQVRRYNFWGVQEASRAEPVLERLTWRCTQPMWHTEGWVGWHDKLAVNPNIILPHTVTIHTASVPKNSIRAAPKELFHINHYTATGIDLDEHPCRSWVKPVIDEGLTWVQLRVHRCRVLRCSRRIPIDCWPFCVLPWAEDDELEPETTEITNGLNMTAGGEVAVNSTEYLSAGGNEEGSVR